MPVMCLCYGKICKMSVRKMTILYYILFPLLVYIFNILSFYLINLFEIILCFVYIFIIYSLHVFIESHRIYVSSVSER